MCIQNTRSSANFEISVIQSVTVPMSSFYVQYSTVLVLYFQPSVKNTITNTTIGLAVQW